MSRGKQGEDYAAAVLEKMGYRILQRNYTSRYGEIDLIASDGHYLCFVEVKTRRKGSMVSGSQAVTPSKQRKIITTALLYLEKQPQDTLQPRFDVFSVETDSGGAVLGHDYLMGAFDSEAYGTV